jgi:diacylglycerol O-acyltransferase / wax synthase
VARPSVSRGSGTRPVNGDARPRRRSSATATGSAGSTPRSSRWSRRPGTCTSGALLIFDPPDDTDRVRFSRFLQLVRSRLHLVPRYRQRLITPPLHSGAPVWVDDRHFDLAYHVRHAALPAPGTTAQLTEYSARILSRQLDRDRPLWELYLIEGLDEGRIALLSKNHHAMVDGLDGVDLATVLFDLDPDASLEIPAPQPWEPRPTPSRSQLAAQQAVRLATSPAEVAESVSGSRPRRGTPRARSPRWGAGWPG